MGSESKITGRTAHQLPAGRHGLARSFVVHNQKERILSAVADVVSLAGYQAMTVEDITATAGVSRRTFYEHFTNKEDAFLAAYDAGVAQLRQIIEEAFGSSDDFVTGVRECLLALTQTLANEPAFAEMCIVEVMAAGQAALERRNAIMTWFAELIDTGARNLLKGPPPPPLTAQTVVGGIYEVLYSRVLRGEVRELPAIVPDLTYSTVLPYVGQDAATQAYTAAGRRRS